MAEAGSFRYRIHKKAECVHVTIRGYRWKRFLALLVWIMFWIAVPVIVLELGWGEAPLGIMSIAFGALFVSLGMWSAIGSFLSYTLILCPPSGLRVRTSFFGISRSRQYRVRDVVRFGFGNVSHSRTTVLSLETQTATGRGKWFGFAYGPTKQEVDDLLDDLEVHGFRLPRSAW